MDRWIPYSLIKRLCTFKCRVAFDTVLFGELVRWTSRSVQKYKFEQKFCRQALSWSSATCRWVWGRLTWEP